MRTRAYRRHQAARVQRKRWLSSYHRWIKSQSNQSLWRDYTNVRIGSGLSSLLIPYQEAWQARYRAKLRDGNGSCSCSMCKPWKFGFDHPYKISERRLIDSVNDKSQPEEQDDTGDFETES